MNQNEIKIQKIRAGHYEVLYQGSHVGEITKERSGLWHANMQFACGGMYTEHILKCKAERWFYDHMTMKNIVDQYATNMLVAYNRRTEVHPEITDEQFRMYLEEKALELYKSVYKTGYDIGFEKGYEEGYGCARQNKIVGWGCLT